MAPRAWLWRISIVTYIFECELPSAMLQAAVAVVVRRCGGAVGWWRSGVA